MNQSSVMWEPSVDANKLIEVRFMNDYKNQVLDIDGF